MFCTQCGNSLQGSPRFCSSCGTAVAARSPAQASPAAPPPTYSPPSTNSVMLNAQGYPQPAFERMASAIFQALDQAYLPQRSGGLEVSKMAAYRTVGGQTIPPYYGEYVLPTYASVVGIELIRNQPPTAPVVSWNGWHQFLIQKILSDPEGAFLHLNRVLQALNIPIVLKRTDFPSAPSPRAQAKEAKFKQALVELAQKSGAAGTGGSAGGGQGDQAARLAMSKMRLAQAQSMGNLMNQVGVSMMNSTDTSGYWYTRR